MRDLETRHPGARDATALVPLYEGMVLTRTFDETAVALQRTGRLGTFASSIGQEAASVGVAAVEYHEGTQTTAFEQIEEKIRFKTQAVLSAAMDRSIQPRQAVLDLAEERVRKAMKLRRF